MDEALYSLSSRSRALVQQPECAEILALPIQGENEAHDIFLSHSGQEKEFVKKLDRALRSAGYDPFFDVLSIPPGKPFPSHILRNAKVCKLGVVVLSPGFLTSKWPMLELFTMITSPLKPILLPLFFRIRPLDLKLESPNFSVWHREWEKIAETDPSRVNFRQWESAAIELSKIQGEVYQSHMSEELFIEAALLRIGSIIRPPLRYDILHLTGHKRLTMEVAQLFEEVPVAIYTSHRKIHAIGLFAVGGQGKTTICKLMVNHYASAYAGRCALIEFPSNDCNEKEVVTQCNKALERLTNSNIHHIDDFDQCLQQMRKQMAQLNVFIAMDNVWENCLHFAQRILDVGFSRGSKILVTSRSRQVLLNLLGHVSYVEPLPGVNKEEAHQMFVKCFNRNQAGLGVLLEDADVHDVTEQLRNNGGYHPLTINAVGVNLARTGGHDWHAAWKHKCLDLTGSGSVTDKAIKINFNSIPKLRRVMFLDVALICIPLLERGGCFFPGQERVLIGDVKVTLLNAIYKGEMDKHVLSAIYKGEMDKHETSRNLMQLAYDGLLEFEDSRVHVHDLYRELASREAAKMLHDWAEAERIVCLSREERMSMPEYVRGLVLPKLRVLIIAKTGNVRGPIHMPQLRVLGLCMDDLSEYDMDLRDMPQLMWLELRFESCTKFPGVVKNISRLTNLSVLVLHGQTRFAYDLNSGLCLDGLEKLESLYIYGIDCLQKISGLGSLINLKYLDLQCLVNLRKVGNFNSCLTQLEFLNISECERLKVGNVVGLISPPNLRVLRFTKRPEFWNMGQLLAFTAMDIHGIALESLDLVFGDEGTGITVNVYGLPKLKTLHIGGVGVTEINCDGGLPRLGSLTISWASNLKQIHFSKLKGLTHLTYLDINHCRSLEEIEWSSLNDLISLTHLKIMHCWHLKEIKGEPKRINQTLRSFTIYGCNRLRNLSGLHLLTNCQFKFLFVPD